MTDGNFGNNRLSAEDHSLTSSISWNGMERSRHCNEENHHEEEVRTFGGNSVQERTSFTTIRTRLHADPQADRKQSSVTTKKRHQDEDGRNEEFSQSVLAPRVGAHRLPNNSCINGRAERYIAMRTPVASTNHVRDRDHSGAAESSCFNEFSRFSLSGRSGMGEKVPKAAVNTTNAEDSVLGMVGTLGIFAPSHGTDTRDNSFPFRLHEMITFCDQNNRDICCWTGKGDGFVVSDPVRLIEIIVKKFFSHTNYASFLRQLNNYGFSKRCEERIPYAAVRERHDEKNYSHKRSRPSCATTSNLRKMPCTRGNPLLDGNEREATVRRSGGKHDIFHHKDYLFHRDDTVPLDRIVRLRNSRRAAADKDAATGGARVMEEVEERVMDRINGIFDKVEKDLASFKASTLDRLDRFEQLLSQL